ncbi:MAG: transcriptional regulator [Acidaminococcaceae bacterium]|nr:transcriptional regulator [Acidaminococcaceae bacterium]
MENIKQTRLLEIFFRSLRGENISVKELAAQYNVSTKSVSRDINDLKLFFADHRDLVGNTELEYSYQDKCYHLYMDEFLTDKELFALAKIIVGVRAFSKEELLTVIGKLKNFTTVTDREKLSEILRKELYHYAEVKHDCESLEDTLWKLVGCITKGSEITVEYYRMDRACNQYRLRPASLLFADHYFYLIAFRMDKGTEHPYYFRVDRIRRITEHRDKIFTEKLSFDEGLLRERSLYMWPGKLRTIRFEFDGPSVQAVLDKLPTAKIIDRREGKYVIEAEVYGDGIKMWLLSQSSWLKVIAPKDFVAEMQETVKKMAELYGLI